MFKLFSVKAKQTGDYVHITGISYYDLSKDIEKFYSTSLVTKWQIKRESWDTIKVHNFFLVELHHILKELLKVRNLRSRRRALSDLQYVLETETWIKDTINPSGTPFDFKKLNAFNTTPFPKQMEFLEQYPVITHSYHLRGLLLDSAIGSGKAMPLSTLVKVPGGWKKLGDLKRGDRVVTPNGKIAKVVGVYSQGKTDVFRFYFEDGRHSDSHPEHLWKVTESEEEGVDSYTHVTTTKDIVKHFTEFTYTVPLVNEINGYQANKFNGREEAAKELLDGVKTIDDSILELPYKERFEIVKSIISSTPCHIGKTNLAIIFDSEQAAVNYQQLAWSIGGIAHTPLEIDGVYKVIFKHRDIDELIYELVGKAPSVAKTFNTSQYKDIGLKITGYEKREPEETLCISIDDDEKLYVVNDYIVTHNTFTSLAWSKLVNDAPTVVLCPLNIVDEVWVKQLKLHFKETPSYWTSKENTPPKEGVEYYIVHYDFMTTSKGGELQKFLAQLNKKHKGQLKLIIDECHNFNDMKAARTRKLVEWADDNIFGHFLPVSGTPLKALGSEIYPILCLIDLFFNKAARLFFLASYGRNRPSLNTLLSNRIGRSKFTIPNLTGLGDPPPVEVIKVKIPNADKYTLDAIRLEMQIYISERIKFYDKNMPMFLEFYTDTLRSYELSIATDPQAMENFLRYKELVHKFRTQGYNSFTDSQASVFCKEVEAEIEKGLRGAALKEFRNIKSAVKYLGLKLRGEALGNVLGKARINAIKDTIEYAGIPEMIDNVEKKTLIFTSYIDALKLCEEYLTKEGYKVVTVYGENSKDRDDAIRRFEKDPSLKALIAVYDSLKEGYPMLMANQTILLNAPFREIELKQVLGRTWRTGQDTLCFFKLLDLDTGDKLNITTRSINIMEWSREQVDSLLSRVEGHELLGNITGQEMMDMSEEPFTYPITTNTSPLSLFM